MCLAGLSAIVHCYHLSSVWVLLRSWEERAVHNLTIKSHCLVGLCLGARTPCFSSGIAFFLLSLLLPFLAAFSPVYFLEALTSVYYDTCHLPTNLHFWLDKKAKEGWGICNALSPAGIRFWQCLFSWRLDFCMKNILDTFYDIYSSPVPVRTVPKNKALESMGPPAKDCASLFKAFSLSNLATLRLHQFFIITS